MTLGEWLDARTPVPPPALAARVRSVLKADSDVPLDDAPDRLLDAAERLLGGVLDAPAGSREAALDLLAADALVTYAFEAAGEDLSTLDERTSAAMMRIVRIVEAVDVP